MNIINPYTVIITFAAGLIALAYFKPYAGRVVCGVFFLVMALGVNVPITLIDPTLFATAGSRALLPVYGWFFSQVLARFPLPFAIGLIVIETGIGLLILNRGKFARLGLGAAGIFCLLLVPIGPEEIPNLLLAVPFFLLLRQDFPQPITLPFIKTREAHRPQG